MSRQCFVIISLTFYVSLSVTIFSMHAFFFDSTRHLLFHKIEETCQSLARALSQGFGDMLSLLEVDREATKHQTLTPMLLGLEAGASSISQLAQDAAVEPTLWRHPINVDQYVQLSQIIRELSLSLAWLDDAAAAFTRDGGETKSVGILDAALPALVALKSEINDALMDVGHLLRFARHPGLKLDLGLRPLGLSLAQDNVNSIAIKAALLRLFMEDEISKVVEKPIVRQLCFYSAMLFSLDRAATAAQKLWTQSYQIAVDIRRSSILFEKKNINEKLKREESKFLARKK